MHYHFAQLPGRGPQMSGLYHFIHRLPRVAVSALCLPPAAPPRLRAACRVLAPLAVLLWLAMIVSIWRPFGEPAMEVLGRAAVVAALAAVVCWAVAVATAFLRDREWREVTLALADALQRLPEDQRRELLVRSVR